MKDTTTQTLPNDGRSSPGYRFDHTTSVGLAKNGWTKPMIDLLLGEPDKLAPNPHNVSGSQMRLYLVERVLKIQNTPAFKGWQRLATSRRKNRRKVERRKERSFGNRLFDIDRTDLSVYSPTQLMNMMKFAHSAGDLVVAAKSFSSEEPLADLEEAMSDVLAGVCRVLRRIEKRLAVELAGRTAVAP
jgi:hypothetical protein